METSLISLASSGKTLPHVKDLNYPEAGAEVLSSLEENHFWFTSRRNVIFKLLKKTFKQSKNSNSNSLKGLDIGCGTGYTAVNFTERGIPTWGVDAHGSFSEYSKSGRAAGFVQGDIFSIQPMQEFDFLLMLDVVEHIQDDRNFLKHALKFLKPGGVALITVPAFSWLWSDFDEIWGHQRRYTKSSFAKLVDTLGPDVRIEKSFYFYAVTLLPYMISRLGRRLANNKRGIASAESDVNPIVNAIIQRLIAVESWFVHLGGMPLGSSLIVQIRKS